MAQTYKFGNGTWARKKGSTLAYSDTNNAFKPLPFSFERNSIATRVNKEGLIEVVGNDIPRIDYTDSTEGALLLENSATNLVTYSEDFTQSAWLKTGLTVNVNQITSPDGGLNADEVDITTANAHYLFDTISVSASTNYTFTFYVKKGTATDVSYSILNETNFTNIVNTTSYFNEISDTDWTRISVEFTTPSGCTSIRTYPLRDGSSTGTIYIWGAMLEQNSVASSYIPTNGSTVQRSAETCNESGNSEVFNDSEGVLFADISFNLEDNYPNLSIFNNTNATKTDNKIVIYKGAPNSNQISVALRSGGSEYANITANVNVENYNKIVISYKLNEVKYYLNGFLIGTDNTVTVPIGLDTLNFDNGAGANDVYGKTKEIGYYDTALTDEELEYMTSYRSLNEMVTELNLNAL